MEEEMKIFLDCSDTELIAQGFSTGLIDGITTNPSLMKKAGQDPKEVIQQISEIFPWDASISAEVIADNADGMIEEAQEYLELGSNITIKVPMTREGLKACKELSADEIPVNVTLVFSAGQAVLAAKAGATYVSPFVGRLYDQYWDGIQLVEEIADVYATHEIKTQVLAASIREARQVPACFRVGADIVTLPWDIFQQLYDHQLTDVGLDKFNKDWQSLQDTLS
jgi:transaldolase